MAFDGITIASIVNELKTELTGGRITKIAQPENDELILTIKTNPRENQPSATKRLFISADAALPLIYLTENNKSGPLTAPGFCMLLRKHLNSGRILDITQPGLERIIHIHIGHLNEMGDYQEKRLVVEIMGKHSNIIFINDENMIIDSIKHISGLVSSVREVLPGRAYFIAETAVKINPLTTSPAEFSEVIMAKAMPLHKAIYMNYTGISPALAQEICYQAGLDGDDSTAVLSEAVVKGGYNEGFDEALHNQNEGINKLYDTFSNYVNQIKANNYTYNIFLKDSHPYDFSVLEMNIYRNMTAVSYDSPSVMLEQYYLTRNILNRIRQKSADLRKIVQTHLERNRKKYELQLNQINDTEKKDRFRIYGELLNTYGYGCEPGAKSLEALDYYSNEMITIPLDPLLSAGENAKKYFDKYNKMKRTADALATLTAEVKDEIIHLESIATSLDIALQEEDLVEIKEEMIAGGYIRRKNQGKREKSKSRPFHYLSSDGFHMYVGKNNFQNEDITFKLADGGDWWFHAKGIPGSHVIIKTEGKELPDRAYEEAAALAAYYSKGRDQEKVEIDYTERKNIKKPNAAKPGFVVYYTNYSMVIAPDISGLKIM
ncbi:MAG: NFACT family protein [Lachnospiraceae bacterium]|nr:NFACT family protein [Lachnospiraceae bacterium]